MSPTPSIIDQTRMDLVVYTDRGRLFAAPLQTPYAPQALKAGQGNWFPAPSPDQLQFAYWSTASGSVELWVFDLGLDRAQRLTAFNDPAVWPEAQNFNVRNAPTWSPDGSRVLFAYRGKVWVIDATGFNLETVISNGHYVAPSWSPDGQLLAVVIARDHTRNLYLRRLATGEEWPLTAFPPAQSVGSPVWSPNGKQIVFSLIQREQVDLWTVDADGNNLRGLTKDGRSNAPAWSPDGRKLLFTTGRRDPDQWEIWSMNPDGNEPTLWRSTSGYSPAWMHVLRDRIRSFAVPTPDRSRWSRSVTAPTAEPTLPRRPAAPIVPPRTATPVIKAIPTAEKEAPPVPTRTASLARATSMPARSLPSAKTDPTSAPTRVVVLPPKVLDQVVATSTRTLSSPRPLMVITPGTVRTPAAVSAATPGRGKAQDYTAYESYADKDQAVVAPGSRVAVTQKQNWVIFTPQLSFYFARDLLKASSDPAIKELAVKLSKYPEAPLIVQGQFNTGSWFNQVVPLFRNLARARANSLLRTLIVSEKIRQINVSAQVEGDPMPDLSSTPANKPILLVIVK